MNQDALDVAMPEKSQIRHAIIAGVLKRHRLGKDEFFGRSRMGELCAARREAAKLLREAGFTDQRIAQILKRERTTIVHYFSGRMLAKKRGHGRLRRILESLDPGVREIVGGIAEAEGVSPRTVILEWISERANHEAEARARAA